jgi:hypothetical protein
MQYFMERACQSLSIDNRQWALLIGQIQGLASFIHGQSLQGI